MSNGHVWRQQRRFAVATLKYFGVGKKTLENFIMQECRCLCDSVQTEKGQWASFYCHTPFYSLHCHSFKTQEYV